ncbi:hypothetical protein EYF80_057761 [Liparis tanakae]|uniref:Uncharacterized protein n=1 Tax=Liparis tanakae TaxID=230148 RepID=A0A4Z2ETW9_9TELE|nr:hypothetical protein EYF80_057761 [Liparis tanakae]
MDELKTSPAKSPSPGSGSSPSPERMSSMFCEDYPRRRLRTRPVVKHMLGYIVFTPRWKQSVLH